MCHSVFITFKLVMAPTGVCNAYTTNTKLEVAQTLLALSRITNLPAPHGKQKKRKDIIFYPSMVPF